MDTFLNILEKIAIIIASITAIFSLNTWRRETVWKRKYELAEEVLSLFYEVRDNLNIIRSPFAYVNEGSTRKKAENETLQQTEEYNKAYVYMERYERVKEPFTRLKSLKYRFMTNFGKESEKSFIEVQGCLNTVLATYNLLCAHYWKYERRSYRSQEELESRVKHIESLENIIWSNTGENDEIENRIIVATKMIEDIVSKTVKK